MLSLSPRVNRTFLLFMSLLVFLPGCASQHSSKSTMLWQSRERFVAAVERDDQGQEAAVANQHPITLSVAKVRRELGALRVNLPGEKGTVPVFGPAELELLTDELTAALQQVKPDQDVIFAMLGQKAKPVKQQSGGGFIMGGGLTKDVVTTGRAFYRKGELNLILGLVREEVREKDRRFQPFTPGSRTVGVLLPGPVSSVSKSASFIANRPDWVVMALQEGADQVGDAQSSAQQISDSPESKLIEDRLKRLKDLREKGLITEDEYRAKRELILNEL